MKNLKKVICLIYNPIILCRKLIELNKNYAIPNFNYQTIETITPNKNSLKEYGTIFFSLIKKGPLVVEDKDTEKSKYFDFCVKTLLKFNENKFQNEVDKSIKMFILLLTKITPNDDIKPTKYEEIFGFIKRLTLLSLYFE